MQLATRCTHCGTSFRVTEAQLAISEGYVRCGRCDAVFNARDALFDLEGGSPSQPMPLAPATAPAPLDRSRDAAPEEPVWASQALSGGSAEAAESQQVTRTEPGWESDPSLDGPDTVADLPSYPRDEPSFAETRDAPGLETGGTASRPEGDDATHPRAPSAFAAPDQPDDQAGLDAPQDANDQLRNLLGVQPGIEAARPPQGTAAMPSTWSSLSQKPAASGKRGSAWGLAAAGLAAALLTLALPLQWAWIEREAFRARSPQLDHWLRQHWPSLPSDGLRQLDNLSVAASSLLATPQGGAYQLELTLHNRGSLPLAMPWIDLRISDPQGKLLVRKSVAPSDLGQAAVLKAGEQRRVQAVFRVKNARGAVSGYEVGLFHP